MMKSLGIDRDSDIISNSSSIPCLLCHQKLSAQTDEHEKHLKLEHKVKFQLSWILKKTWKDWLNNLSNMKTEIERKLLENDSMEGFKIEPGISEENDQPYFSPSKLLVEMSADDDPKQNTDLDQFYSASELLANDCTNYNENEQNVADLPAAFDQSNAARKYKKKKHNIAGNSNKPYECSICEKAFKIKNYVKIHEKKEHNVDRKSNKTYQCSVCIKAFNTKFYIKIHEKKEHNITIETLKPYPCTFCEKGFKTKSYVEIHEKTHAGEIIPSDKQKMVEEKITIPDLTGSSVARIYKEKKHNIAGNSNKPYECSICDKAFKIKNYVKTHEKKEHNYKRESLKPYPCSFCEKGFKTKYYVEIHKKTHSGELGESHMCSFEGCEKECLTSDDLKIHLKTHKKQKYKCSICAKGFKTKDYVLVHEKKSHDYQCSVCEKSFTNQTFARVHEKKKHSHVKVETDE